MRKIIFLDINGVLVQERYPGSSQRNNHGKADPACVAALNVLIEQTGAALVLIETACWGGLHHLTCLLSDWGVRGSILGALPMIAVPENLQWVTPSRDRRIREWLKLYGMNVSAYVVLDDNRDIPPFLAGKQVCSRANVGLTVIDVKLALAILNQNNVSREAMNVRGPARRV